MAVSSGGRFSAEEAGAVPGGGGAGAGPMETSRASRPPYAAGGSDTNVSGGTDFKRRSSLPASNAEWTAWYTSR